MADGQSAFAEPMSMEEALSKVDSLIDEAKEAEAEEAAQGPQEGAEEIEEVESAEEDQSEADEPQDEEEESEQVLTVEEYGDVLVDIDGTPTPLKDVLQGTLRQADYTRKTQALKEQEKALKADLAEREKALEAREQQLTEMAAEFEDPEPDWVAMADEDPLGWVKAKAEWDRKQAKKQAQKAEHDKRAQAARDAFKRKTIEIAIEKMPEMADVEAFSKGADARKAVALAAGFTEEEYGTTADFRLAIILEKAARYDAQQGEETKKRVSAEKKIAKAPKVLRPGQSKGDADPAAERRAARQKRFSKPISSDTIKGMIGRR